MANIAGKCVTITTYNRSYTAFTCARTRSHVYTSLTCMRNHVRTCNFVYTLYTICQNIICTSSEFARTCRPSTLLQETAEYFIKVYVGDNYNIFSLYCLPCCLLFLKYNSTANIVSSHILQTPPPTPHFY